MTETTGAGGPAPRHVDARTLRGLAHPLRIHILEVLKLEGPATSAGLAERLGENTGTLSWHLRHLAAHGFIEEETGRGTRRERWWRAVRSTMVLDSAELRADPAARGAFAVSDWTHLRLTPDRLRALTEELARVVASYAPDPDAEPEADALPVVVQVQAFPYRAPGAGDEG
ncbi:MULTISPECIES: winged helix-turn-helix domain-containing protein [Streptomycetaceae]|uniref:Putative transcriptional regulator protein, ArsR family n=1 Tax=Streptantibioticus cattleyicolor (strain ATCC 35852 / DSM 46488 / JCM 4925 / NBRC 14057 / NRRL 8057) TaxID=1003195 RepID=G8WMT9_STREN|nr:MULTISPECIES: helix-turn-helix domain-containing protein [Streptomycetaceae]AEW92658.1 putative transcriptional regulator protein, ArsR family [Streptantibioticus cattleyicolor NRRL 8057 = DSM 46488]MYS57433.1 helix-turn-helix domain-containing protein [Streptomyces sp. SID5468]